MKQAAESRGTSEAEAARAGRVIWRAPRGRWTLCAGFCKLPIGS
jgi:hypothetical protein